MYANHICFTGKRYKLCIIDKKNLPLVRKTVRKRNLLQRHREI